MHLPSAVPLLSHAIDHEGDLRIQQRLARNAMFQPWMILKNAHRHLLTAALTIPVALTVVSLLIQAEIHLRMVLLAALTPLVTWMVAIGVCTVSIHATSMNTWFEMYPTVSTRCNHGVIPGPKLARCAISLFVSVHSSPPRIPIYALFNMLVSGTLITRLSRFFTLFPSYRRTLQRHKCASSSIAFAATALVFPCMFRPSPP